MDALFETIRQSSLPLRAVAVTVGGLTGVFATLTIFYLLISLGNRIGGKGE